MANDWETSRRALAETQAWVSERLPIGHPGEALRSQELSQCLSNYPEDWLYSEVNVQNVRELIRKRSELLALTSPHLLPNHMGKLLRVMAGQDTAMGEGTQASDGVIDDTYFPPWDTWVAFLEPGLLLAWIPASLEPLVQNAIDVSASQHILWISDARGDVFREAEKRLS